MTRLRSLEAVLRSTASRPERLGSLSARFLGPGDPRVYWTNLGRYFGYPECCIRAFLEQDLPDFSTFDGTGFRPCRACNALPRHEVLTGIAQRRQHPEPFPASGGLTEEVRRTFYGV